MYKLSIELLEKLSDILQTGKSSPNHSVTVWRGDKKGDYEQFPFVLPDLKRITIDRRWHMAADELEVEMSDINGFYSPEYSNKKEFHNVSNLPLSGYKGVIKAYNKVECYLGYGNSLVKMFTGQIQNVDISENSMSISFKALNSYRKLLKPIDPIHTRELIYENQKAFDIIMDLCNRAGINKDDIIYDNETITDKDTKDETTDNKETDSDNKDNDTVEDKEFIIKNKICFPLGTNYSDSIKDIINIMNHRIVGNRDGKIEILKCETYNQQDFHNWEFDDFVNMSDGTYQIDTSVIRNRVIIMSDNGWQAFEDKFLIEYCNGEIISSGLEAKWAETLEQKWAMADNFFMSMRRKLRRISVAVVGNPAMDVGDLVKMRMLTSTANDKYIITAIQSSYTDSAYIDQVDLEYIGTTDKHLCEQAEGEYETEENEEVETSVVVMTLRDKIVDEAKKYLGIYYQWGGTYPETYGLDCSHFTWRVLSNFGIMDKYKIAKDQKNWCKTIPRGELKPGDLVFYTWGGGSVKHVVMYIGNGEIIGANGGDSTTTSIGKARNKKAQVKIQSIDYGQPAYYGRPQGLD